MPQEPLHEFLKGAMSGLPEEPPKMPRETPPIPPTREGDKAVLGLCELLALLFGLPFGDDLYHGTPITLGHIVYLCIAVLFAVGGPMWPRIKTRLRQDLSATLSRAASDAKMWLLVLLALFAYTIGPDIYRRATAPTSSTSPSEISPNPLHTVAAKWALAQNLQGSPFINECYIVISRLPTDYAERVADDLKSVLNTVGWKFSEYLSLTPLPRVLSLRSEETGPSRDCANFLFSKLNGSGLSWSTREVGGNLAVPLDFFPKESLGHECYGAIKPCVRIGVGNEPLH